MNKPDYSNSKPLDVHRWSDYPEVSAVINKLHEELLANESRQRARSKADAKKFKQTLHVIVLDLFMTHSVSNGEQWIAFPRNKNAYSGGTRYHQIHLKYQPVIDVTDGLRELGYIDYLEGWRDEQGKSFLSRMKAKEELIEVIRTGNVSVTMIQSIPSELIILKDSNKKETEYVDSPVTKKMRKNLERINESIANTYINIELSDVEEEAMGRRLSNRKDDIRYLDFSKKCLHRVFNNGSFEQGGRFYGGWWQSVPGDYRKCLLIDDFNVCEPDFSGMHPHMMYTEVGLPVPDNPYELNGYPDSCRPLIKTVFNAMINATSKRLDIRNYDLSSLPQGKTFKNLQEDILEKHKAISACFYSGKGVHLQYKDSCVAEAVMLRLLDEKIIVLPVHDSFIVQQRHEERLRQVMWQEYEGIVGAIPIIKGDPAVKSAFQRFVGKDEPTLGDIEKHNDGFMSSFKNFHWRELFGRPEK